jgi:hypothetical protein
MALLVHGYLIGVIKEEEAEPIWVYPADLEVDEEGEFLEGEFLLEENLLIFPEDIDEALNPPLSEQNFTAHKRVDKKVKPVPGTFPKDARVTCCIPRIHYYPFLI